MTFWRYLTARATWGADDPIEDLWRDAAEDATWPRRVSSLKRLHLYLSSRNACPEAHEALTDAHDEWRMVKLLVKAGGVAIRGKIFMIDAARVGLTPKQ